MEEFQELWCHDCSRYVQFKMDMALDGNHVIICPNCGHEHLRVVRSGEITDIRWGSRNRNNVLTAVTTGTTKSSTYTTYTSTANDITKSFYASAWAGINVS